MKLGELRGERAIEVIADLIEPIANIASDQKNLQLFRAKQRDGETARETAVRDLTEKIPILLRTHKKDVLDILCAVNGTKPEELSALDILKGAIELGHDQDFLALFISAVGTEEKTPPTGYSAKAEHTKPVS